MLLKEKDYITGYMNSPNKLFYSILETSYDHITKKTWHKILGDEHMIAYVVKQSKSQWDIHREINGHNFLWVTDKLLLLSNIHGAVKTDD